MILTLQCTTKCEACGHATTPVNAAVPQIACRGCGAAIVLGETLWRIVFEDLTSHRLAENDRGSECYRQAGAILRVAFSAVEPRCPHCDATWKQVPDEGAWACPDCGTPVSLRVPPQGGALQLVAEDRELLGSGSSDKPLELACRSCGHPLTAGEKRRVVCEACTTETVVPDEAFRRLNAPDTVARWMVRVDARATGNPLARLRAYHLVAGPGGVLIACGRTAHLDHAVVAIETNSRTIRWIADASELGGDLIPAILPDGRVVVARERERGLWFAGPAGLGPRLDTEDAVEDFSVHPSGDLIVCMKPRRGLVRLTAAGETRPLWNSRRFPRSLVDHLFGPKPWAVEPPVSRMGALYPGRLGQGHDGNLRFVSLTSLSRFSADGTMVWCVQIPDSYVSIVAPCASRDGTTWVAYRDAANTEDRVARFSGDGKFQANVHRADSVSAIACDADGTIWVAASDRVEGSGSSKPRLSCFDGAGNLLWQVREPD